MRIRPGEKISARGKIESIRYASSDGEFQVVVLRTDQGDRVPCVVRGAGLLVDEEVRVEGEGARHKSGELQIEVESAIRTLPATRDGLVSFLSSSLIDGIGPKYAERIVAMFGEDTPRVLSEESHRLRDVEGIGPERARKIRDSWGRSEAIRGIIIFLQSHGISPAYANRIYRHYGQRAVAVLEDNPYRLARDVRGIGFIAADRIARQFGIGLDDPRRHEAGVLYVLHMAKGEGHTCLPLPELVEEARRVLKCDESGVTGAVERLISARELVRESADELECDVIFTKNAFRTEAELVSRVSVLLGQRPAMMKLTDADRERIESEFSFPLAPGQHLALKKTTGEPLAILTGGPGTGKTTIVRALVGQAVRHNVSIALAAPTGRAAQRLAEATGREAKTVHRLLEFDPREGGFKRDEVEPLEEQLIIVDESSMLDAELGKALLRAIGPQSSLILVGDRDQLPPVGAGKVLADLIASNCVPVAALDQVFRQGLRSEIVTASHLVRAGTMPEPSSQADGEFFFIRREDPVEIVETIREVVAERFPRAFGYDPVDDVQVLVPVHRGGVGTRELNATLQQALGGEGAHIEFGKNRYHVGDKVMQTRNNYRLETFNGDIGRVIHLDNRKRTLVVDYDGREVEYETEDLIELELAYAITVHKSQGSEFPAVVLALSTHHYTLLNRKLVYTAMTRARERLVIVGKPHAFQMAIDNVSSSERYTRFAVRLRERCSELNLS